MKIQVRVLRRLSYILGVAIFLFTLGAPVTTSVAAAAQLQQRSITLSDSGASGGTITTGVGSGTNVSYQVAFTTLTSAQSIVIDFCSNSPIIADNCTAPAGMNAGSAVLSGSGNVTSPGWTATDTASRIKLSDSSGTATGVGSQVFTLAGITNPNTSCTGQTGGLTNLCSFYARIYTYSDNNFGAGSYTSATAPGTYVDYGGIALSTNNIITITARVQEQLTFCISGAVQTNWATTHDCSDPQVGTNPPAVVLGHGSPTPTLDSSAVDTGSVYSQLSTNATNGAVIAMRNSNTACGGLSADGGLTCAIPAAGATPVAITAGTASFGMFVPASTDDTNGTGSLTPTTPYNGNGHVTVPTDVRYGMDNATTVGTDATHPQYGNDKTTYGSEVATTSSPVYRVDNSYLFGATASLTTPAGIYTANLDMIATGTF